MKSFLLIIFILTEKFAQSQIIVANDIFRNLYVGVTNPISISVQNVPDANVVLKSNYGTIKKVSKAKFIWQLCSADRRYVYLRIYNKAKLIDSIPFKVLSIPNPQLFTCNPDDRFMFKNCPGVRADIVNFEIEGIPCRVEKCTITITKKTGENITIHNQGKYYQDEARTAFKNLKEGEKVVLSDFSVTVGCETKLRQLTDVLSMVYTGKYEFMH